MISSQISAVGKVEMLRVDSLMQGTSYPVFVRAFNVEDETEMEGELSDENVILVMPLERKLLIFLSDFEFISNNILAIVFYLTFLLTIYVY